MWDYTMSDSGPSMGGEKLVYHVDELDKYVHGASGQLEMSAHLLHTSMRCQTLQPANSDQLVTYRERSKTGIQYKDPQSQVFLQDDPSSYTDPMPSSDHYYHYHY